MKELEFNNEIIDGQSTVADNLAKANRNFMLLQEILGIGASSQDIQNMLETISQTYVKTADIVNNLNSSDTNKPVSALQAKNLKNELIQLNQNIFDLTQQLRNKAEKTTHLPNNTDFNTLTQPGSYSITTGGINAPVVYDISIPTHWNVNVYWGNPNTDVFYQIAQTIKEPNKLFKRHCINGGYYPWATYIGDNYNSKTKIEHMPLSNKIQSLIDLGYESGQFTCGNCPDMPFQNWGACLRYSHNESDVYLATLHQSSTQNVYFRYYSAGQKKWIINWQKYTTVSV